MVGLLGVFMVEKLVPLFTFAQGIVMKGRVKKVAKLITCSLTMTKEKSCNQVPSMAPLGLENLIQP
jgi:hypothetical protein